MIRKSTLGRRVAVALAVALVLQAAATVPATAQSDDDQFFDGVITSDESWAGSVVNTVTGVTGGLARYQEAAKERVGLSEPGDATSHANAAGDAIEANNETIRTYANTRLSPTTGYETFAIHFNDDEGNTATRYVVTDVANQNWTSGPRVLTESEFNATGRSVDHWIALDWFASKHADEGITTFVDEFAKQDKNVSSTHRAGLLSKYGSGIKSDMWGDESPTFEG